MLIRKSENSYLIECSVIPKSREEKIVGVVADTLKVKLTAPPTDGKANKQLIRLLAREFKLKAADIQIIKGSSSRQKTISVAEQATLPDCLAQQL